MKSLSFVTTSKKLMFSNLINKSMNEYVVFIDGEPYAPLQRLGRELSSVDTVRSLARLVSSVLELEVNDLYFYYYGKDQEYHNMMYDVYSGTKKSINNHIAYDYTLESLVNNIPANPRYIDYANTLLSEIPFGDDGEIYCLTRANTRQPEETKDRLFVLQDDCRLPACAMKEMNLLRNLDLSKYTNSNSYEVVLKVLQPEVESIRLEAIFNLLPLSENIPFVGHSKFVKKSIRINEATLVPEKAKQWTDRFEGTKIKTEFLSIKMLLPNSTQDYMTVTVHSTGSLTVATAWKEGTLVDDALLSLALKSVNDALLAPFSPLTSGLWQPADLKTNAKIVLVNNRSTFTGLREQLDPVTLLQPLEPFFVLTNATEETISLRFTRSNQFNRLTMENKVMGKENKTLTLAETNYVNKTNDRGDGLTLNYTSGIDVSVNPSNGIVHVKGTTPSVLEVIKGLLGSVLFKVGTEAASTSFDDIAESIASLRRKNKRAKKGKKASITITPSVTKPLSSAVAPQNNNDYYAELVPFLKQGTASRLEYLKSLFKAKFDVNIDTMSAKKPNDTFVKEARGFSSKCQPKKRHPVVIPTPLVEKLTRETDEALAQIPVEHEEVLQYRKRILESAMPFEGLDDWMVFCPEKFNMKEKRFVELSEDVVGDYGNPSFTSGFYYKNIKDGSMVMVDYPCCGKRATKTTSRLSVKPSAYVVTGTNKEALEGQRAKLPDALESIFTDCFRIGVGGSFLSAIDHAFGANFFAEKVFALPPDDFHRIVVQQGPLSTLVEPATALVQTFPSKKEVLAPGRYRIIVGTTGMVVVPFKADDTKLVYYWMAQRLPAKDKLVYNGVVLFDGQTLHMTRVELLIPTVNEEQVMAVVGAHIEGVDRITLQASS